MSRRFIYTTPITSSGLNVNYLLVGGGGRGGSAAPAYNGGGGGGGEVIESSYTITPDIHTITITIGGQSTDSYIGSYKARKGGDGQYNYTGGNCGDGIHSGNAGGGGDGGNGYANGINNGGNGGAGIASVLLKQLIDGGKIAGSAYCGGGGGAGAYGDNPGFGGSSIGGNGGYPVGGGSAATAGTTNRGGGGGGAAYANGGYGAGGSGVCVVRYNGTTPKASGGLEYTTGGYYFHVFNTSGTLTIL